MEKIIVISIIASAGIYLFIRFRKALKGEGCGGACSGCSMSKNCSSKKDGEER